VSIGSPVLIERLALDEPPATARRRIIIGTILSFAASDWPMFVEWMRYPEDLPDLNDPKHKPRTNS